MPYYIDAKKVELEDLMFRITESDLVPSRRKLLEDIEVNLNKLKEYGIYTMADLRKSIKNPKKIASLAEKTHIEIQYLTLLRREVESYFPKAYPLSVFDWLEKNQITKLERKGYKNTALLYEAFEIPSKREEITALTGPEKAFAEEIFILVDLIRIQWVSPIFSKVLVEAGYNNAKSIAEANAKELHEAVEKTNKKGRYFKGKIGIRDIARLIKSASYLS
ncbi:MAG: DUF4332 domain-containing protein [Firmicutes bacterium]|nr:DUF4332 domain-containing protein [Bacillota bacterium]